MSDTLTTYYGFTLPAIGASQDSWGNKLNANWTALDGTLHSITVGGGTYLPLTGGTVTGNLTLNGTTYFKGLAYFGYGPVNDFILYRGAPNRTLQWAGNTLDFWNEQTGTRYWRSDSIDRMTLTNAGNLTITGSATKPGGGSWTASSDDRVKNVLGSYDAGLEQVCALAPIAFSYNGKGGTAVDAAVHIGLSAQHTQRIMPELVHEMTGDEALPGQLGIQAGPLVFALINAVRELRDRVAALETQLA